jgi:hypothetical protein
MSTSTLCAICKQLLDGACKCSAVDKARKAQITLLEGLIAKAQKRAKRFADLARYDEMNAVLDEVAALQAGVWALRAQLEAKS